MTKYHIISIHKLTRIGINGNVLYWIKSYLSNRKQCIHINSSYSNFQDVVSGIPQRSIIGTLLLLIYINDIPSIIKPPLSISLFADDAKISCTSSAEMQKLQSGLDAISEWMHTWKLELARPNCYIMIIATFITPPYYTMDKYMLSICSHYKYMGIKISNDLSLQVLNSMSHNTHM